MGARFNLFAVQDDPDLTGIELGHGPECIIDEAMEQFGRQNALAVNPADFATYGMQVRGTQRQVKLISLVFDIVEIMGIPRLVEKLAIRN